MPTARRKSPRRPTRNPAHSPKADSYIEMWQRMLPRGTTIHAVLRNHAASGTRTLGLVFAPEKGEIVHVPPSLIRAAGLRYNEKKDGAVFTGGGYSALHSAAEALGMFLYGDDRALKYATGYV